MNISRVDTAGTAPGPLSRKLLGSVTRVRESSWCSVARPGFSSPVVLHEHPGEYDGGAPADTGRPGHPVFVGGAFELAPDQALIIPLPAGDAPYLGFQLGSAWYISLDYINHQTSSMVFRLRKIRTERFASSSRTAIPDLNWVETLGHAKGAFCSSAGSGYRVR